jgi:hypothetical protein
MSAMPSPTALLITFCIGIAATLTWQSYGEMVASPPPQLGQQQLSAISLDLDAVRQSVDRLTSSHERMTREITKLQAVEQDILQKISAPTPRPETALSRKPAPRSSQAPTVR